MWYKQNKNDKKTQKGQSEAGGYIAALLKIAHCVKIFK